jgi:hypothetical protein
MDQTTESVVDEGASTIGLETENIVELIVHHRLVAHAALTQHLLQALQVAIKASESGGKESENNAPWQHFLGERAFDLLGEKGFQ